MCGATIQTFNTVVPLQAVQEHRIRIGFAHLLAQLRYIDIFNGDIVEEGQVDVDPHSRLFDDLLANLMINRR